jgi:peroxiredoxin Q/BCP
MMTPAILDIGAKAPDFVLDSDQHLQISLSQFLGKKVLLYFYPKDDTPGCTRQACDFRDDIDKFAELNVEVIGISKDSASRHQKFKQKYALPFTLLVDADGGVCEAYGVMDKKSLFGKSFLGINRSTFLIDEQGVIVKIWRKVKVTGHSAAILNELTKVTSE